eukprot:gene8525-10480_t
MYDTILIKKEKQKSIEEEINNNNNSAGVTTSGIPNSTSTSNLNSLANNNNNNSNNNSNKKPPIFKRDKSNRNFLKSFFSSPNNTSTDSLSSANTNTPQQTSTPTPDNSDHGDMSTLKITISNPVDVPPLINNITEYLSNIFNQKESSEIFQSFQYYGNEIDYSELYSLHQNSTIEKSGYKNTKLLSNFLMYLLQNICIVQSTFSKEIGASGGCKKETLEYRSEVFDRLPIKNPSMVAPCIMRPPVDPNIPQIDRIDQQTYTYLIHDKPVSKNEGERRTAITYDIIKNIVNYLAFSKLKKNFDAKKHVIKGEETLHSFENVFCVDKCNFVSGRQVSLGEIWITNYRLLFVNYPTTASPTSTSNSQPTSPVKRHSSNASQISLGSLPSMSSVNSLSSMANSYNNNNNNNNMINSINSSSSNSLLNNNNNNLHTPPPSPVSTYRNNSFTTLSPSSSYSSLNGDDASSSSSSSMIEAISSRDQHSSCDQLPIRMIHRWVHITSSIPGTNGISYDIFKIYLKDFRVKILGFPSNSPLLNQFISILESFSIPTPQNIFALLTPPQPTDQVCHPLSEDNYIQEFNRQGINWNMWRVSKINSKYKVCRHYPSESVVIKTVADDSLLKSAFYRNSRFPFLTWVHSETKATLCRSSAPSCFIINPNIRSSQLMSCEDDNRLLSEIASSPTNKIISTQHQLQSGGGAKMIIFDTGSVAMNLSQSQDIELINLCLPQIDSVREAYHKILLLHEDPHHHLDTSWIKWEQVIKYEWLNLLKPILAASISIADTLASGRHVLIQNSSLDSDCDVQLSSISQILLDPYYRTLGGFQTLLEKEWLKYGHPFGKRSGNDLLQTRVRSPSCISPSLSSSSISSQLSSASSLTPNGAADEQLEQFSPIFMQFIFIIWQISKEFPTQFEFNETYLITILDSIFSCRFGTFLCNNTQERENYGIFTQTKCIWRYIQKKRFLNPLYAKGDKVHQRLFCKGTYDNALWSSFLMRYSLRSSFAIELFYKKSSFIRQLDVAYLTADFSSIGIFYLPRDSFQRLYNLCELSLANNNLTTIPTCLFDLIQLEKLNLAGNQLVAISEESVSLLPKSLRSLNFSSNCLEDLPLSLVELNNLEELNISRNNFKKIPTVLMDHIETLVSLDISYCHQLESFDVPTKLTKTLSCLVACGLDKVHALPEELGNLSSLKALNISDNDFTSEGRLLPWSISRLVDLEELVINNCKITAFPLQVLALRNLKRLSLVDNLLTKLPNDIGPLSQLEELHLSRNRLEQLPSSIGQLTQLQVINIDQNQITELRPSMGLLAHLHQLKIEGNPIRTPPPEIIQKGHVQILQFLKDLSKGQQECYRMKLMIVGQENVGKTTLIKVLRDKKKTKILQAQPNISTDGIIIDDWVLSGGQVKTKSKTAPDQITLTTMDFAGQEVYYTTHQFFLSERSIYIVVWNTCLEEEASRVEFWLQSISTRAPNSPIIIVGTHIDDLEGGKNSAKILKKRMEDKYMPLFPNIKVIKLVSCTSGKGVTSLRENIEEIACNQPNMGELLPSSYILLENLVKEERRNRAIPTIPWSDFIKLGKMCTIDDEAELIRAAVFLTQLGSLVYFPKEIGLKKIVILDPQWITLMLASIITVKHNYTNSGVILHKNLKHIWKPPHYPVDLHPHLLVLLERFEISFNFSGRSSSQELTEIIDDDSQSLIPALLSNDCPSNFQSIWNPSKKKSPIQYSRQYKFDFIPNGLFSRLMVRILNFAGSESKLYWRNGILLQRDDEQILVELVDNLKLLRFNVKGKGKQSVAQLSRDVIDTIQSLLDDSFKLKPKEINIPCTHCIQEGNDDYPYLFSLQQCEQAVLKCEPYLKCRQRVNVRTDHLVPDLSMYNFTGTKITSKELEIQQLIGEGGSALVYIGRYRGKVVAIKKIKTPSEEDEDQDGHLSQAFTEFRRECWVMSGLDHPNIVRLEGLCLDPLSIVTEYLPEGNLHRFLQLQRESPQFSGRLDWALCLELALDIASGMTFLHSSSPPIIHRDLKSPNILLVKNTNTSPDRAKLGDGLLAKVADFGLSGLQYTITNRCVVNPVWLAPEVMNGLETSTKSDVYSFGVILWELLTCKEFFGEVKFFSQLEDMVIAGNRPEIPDCDPRFSKLIQDCWNNDPKKRPNFQQIVNSLKKIKSSSPSSSPANSPPSSPQPSSSSLEKIV